MSGPFLPLAIGAPNTWPIVISSSLTGVDLRTVTAVSLGAFRSQDQSRATWTPAIQGGATATQLTALLSFTGAEITVQGPYDISVTLTTPGGPVPASAIQCFGVDPHELPPTILPAATSVIVPILMAIAASVANPAAVASSVDLAGVLQSGSFIWVVSLHAHFILDRLSVATPDNVLVIAANGGGNWLRWPQGDVNGQVRATSGQSFFLKQGGTAGAPSIERPLSFQYSDATLPPYSIYATSVQSFGITDNVVRLGYNAGNEVAGEPIARWVVENNFANIAGPTNRTLECYIESGAAGFTPQRPFGFVVNRSNGAIETVVAYSGSELDIIGGPVGTPIQQLRLTDSSFQCLPDPYAFSSVGEMQFFSTKRIFVWPGSGAAGIPLLVATDAWQLCDHTTSQFGAIDFSGGALRIYPINDNTGSLGIAAGGTWANIRAYSSFLGGITVAQTSQTSNYTIDSGTKPDCEIWVNSTGGIFTVTLPTPTAGRKLWIVDSGNGLAGHTVTLARHGSENINGAGTSLALVTSGARYEISSDGTNWWVNKMVLGG